MADLLGYSDPESLQDDSGDVQGSAVVVITGPGDYSGTATSDPVTGVLRIGPLPIGEYTGHYGARTWPIPVYAQAADVQDAYDGAAAVGDDIAAALADEITARNLAITTAIDALVAGAPGTLNTLNEIAAQLATDESAAAAIVASIAALDKASVGLGNVDNTSDANKPVSTATAAAITAAVDALVAGAPGALNTLNELATQLASDETAAAALTTAVGLRGIDVSHGSTAGTARPTSTLPVTWHGTAVPSNAIARDLWYDEANDLLKRYTGSAWVAAGSGAYAPISGSLKYRAVNPNAVIANLWAAYPTGVVCAHRNGPMTLPEDTVLGGQACVAAGVPMLQFNVWALPDGTSGCVHDSTIDRTTTSSGNIADQTSASLLNLVLDPVTYTGPGWANIPNGVPTATQLLDAFGGNVALMFELMDTVVKVRLTEQIVARGLQKTVIFTSRFYADLAYPISQGIEGWFIDDTGATPAATLLAAGVTGVCVKSNYVTGSGGVSQAAIDAYRAAGLKICIYTILRETDYYVNAYTPGTIDVIASDDPLYTQSVHSGTYRHRVTSDKYGAGFFVPGMFPGKANANVTTYKDANNKGRGTILSGGRWQFDGGNPGTSLWAMLGSFCPIATPTAFTFSFSLSIDTADTTTSSWAAIFLCAATDASYNDGAGLTAANSGYQFLIRQTGSMESARIDAGVGTSLTTQATAALTTSSVATFTIQVTSTQVILTRTDSGGFTPLVITHSGYRGAYLHWGAKINTGNGRYSIKALSIA